MKNKLLVLVTVAVGMLIAAGSMFAHHSDAVFNHEHITTITGTVTKHMFINPLTEFTSLWKRAMALWKNGLSQAVLRPRCAGWAGTARCFSQGSS